MNVVGRPKALLFDIGGVCVLSPFQAILDYERAQKIPSGWVNFSISRSAPNGAWQKLERGEVELNDDFFKDFNRDLNRPELWLEFLSRQRSLSPSSNQSAGQITSQGSTDTSNPPLPNVDAERLFWNMMGASRTPDPWVYPALQRLKGSGKFILGALSNTVIFPPPYEQSHALHEGVRGVFDMYISSAHVGLRKPDPRIYELALKQLSELSVAKGTGPLDAGDVVFFDDIGENLKSAKKVGFRTVRVVLGKSKDAVLELEDITGLRLRDEEARL